MKKGLLHVYCGDGKGKTTCAIGLAVRCAGAGGKVLLFQFLKRDTSSERKSLEKMNSIVLMPGYEKMKFTFKMTETEKQDAITFYKRKMQEIQQKVEEEEYDLLILDEAIGAVNAGMLEENELCTFLENRPNGLEVVLTGRDPSNRILDLADYISNIQKIRHPFDKGIPARRMIEM